MTVDTSTTSGGPLLTPAQLSRVERLRLNARRRFTNRTRGEHLRGRGGNSTEFSDYRDYHEGDDIRHVDWNIYARLRRPYLKIFQQEEEMHVVLLVDASASMAFEDKFAFARRLAAALGVMALLGQEKVSAWSFNRDNQPVNCPPGTGRAARPRLMRFLEGLAPGATLPLDAMVERVLALHRGKGVMMLLSDFLVEADFPALFNRIHSASLEPMALQILGPSEMDPALADDARLEDSENGLLLDVTAGDDLLRAYQDYRAAFCGHIENLVRQRGGLYACVSADRPFESVLTEDLQRKGWVVSAR
jgi:uncharacterized protein (DUF58 family)